MRCTDLVFESPMKAGLRTTSPTAGVSPVRAALRYVAKAVSLKVAQIHNMKKNTVEKNTL